MNADPNKHNLKRNRKIDRIKLSPHADLKTRREGDILVLPERAMRLGGSGGEILRLCLTPTTADEIIAELSDRHPDAPDLDSAVSSFLNEMIELGGLIHCSEGSL